MHQKEIEYRVCGIEEYEYPESMWDCVVSNLALHYIENNIFLYSSKNFSLSYSLFMVIRPSLFHLCKIFIDEIFGSNVPMNFDDETLTTINKFFENNLNVSETSRQLYVIVCAVCSTVS